MDWILLEVFVALVLAFLIVAWTASARRRSKGPAKPPQPGGDDQ